MTRDVKLKDNRIPLQGRAEHSLTQKSGDDLGISALSIEDVKTLVHELQVPQIEPEVQNEELRKAQQDLEHSRSKYQDLYDFAPVGYVTLNEKGLILDANLTACRLFGVKRQALMDSQKQQKMFLST